LLGCSAEPTLLTVMHLQADSHPENAEHRADKCYLHCCSCSGLFGFPQTSAAHLYLAYLRDGLDENLGGKFIPLVTLRDAVLLYVCALNDKAKGQ